MILLSFLLAATGLTCLGLTSIRHHGWLLGNTGHRPWEREALRAGAALTLAASLAAAMAGWGAAQGAVGWCGLLSLAAAMLLLIRTFAPWRPRR